MLDKKSTISHKTSNQQFISYHNLYIEHVGEMQLAIIQTQNYNNCFTETSRHSATSSQKS